MKFTKFCRAFCLLGLPVATANVAFAQSRTKVTDIQFDGPVLSGPQLVAPPLQQEPIVGQNVSLTPAQVFPQAISDSMLRFLEEAIRENIPPREVIDKDWGKQKKVYAGFRFRKDGWRLETERRWKEVDHGIWRRVDIAQVDPAQHLTVRLSDVHWQPNGMLHASVQIGLMAKVKARQAHWTTGVRLYSVHVEATTRLQLHVSAEIAFHMLPTEIPPVLQIVPNVTEARIALSSFEVDEIGHLGGDLAEELGDLTESLIRNEIVKPQSRKLKSKLNRQLDKKKDRLTFSLNDWLSDFLELNESEQVEEVVGETP